MRREKYHSFFHLFESKIMIKSNLNFFIRHFSKTDISFQWMSKGVLRLFFFLERNYKGEISKADWERNILYNTTNPPTNIPNLVIKLFKKYNRI